MELLRLTGIGKTFGPNRVLDNVSLDLQAGEVHLLAGENGAGKSTLIKILAGIHTDYDGLIVIAGRPVRFRTPLEANLGGVSVIHQEMSLVDSMSVADNICLGREPACLGGLLLDRPALLKKVMSLGRELGLEFSEMELHERVENFPLSVKNQIEIAKALAFEARIVVMDEPTSALNRHEVERLFDLIESLKARGCGIIYISHKMEEIYRIADRITVLRDGRHIGTAPIADCPEPRLVQWMIGREISRYFPPRAPVISRRPEELVMAVDGFEVPHPDPRRPAAVRNVSFSLARGEIVGLAGLQGSGIGELFQGLFGALGQICPGRVRLRGRDFIPTSPARSIARGLAYLTVDRKATGLVLGLSIRDNITLAALARLSPGGWLRPADEHAASTAQVQALGIRSRSTKQVVGTLSGGNQQKVALAKWLETKPDVLLLEEPTRGVDVGAKQEIYALLRRWTAQGMTILMASTELPELLGLCDRIMVMHRGEITGRFDRGEATAENILSAAMGRRETAPTAAV